jgi:hypothetical protein
LVHHKAFEADQHRERHDLFWAPTNDAENEIGPMPDQAEVTDMTRGGEDTIGDDVAANPIERLVNRFVEALDGWPQVMLPGNVAAAGVGIIHDALEPARRAV